LVSVLDLYMMTWNQELSFCYSFGTLFHSDLINSSPSTFSALSAG